MSIAPESDIVTSIKRALEASNLSPIIRCEISGENDSCGAKLDAIIVSAKFEGMPLLQRQKAVHDAVSNAHEACLYPLVFTHFFADQNGDAACSRILHEDLHRCRGRKETPQIYKLTSAIVPTTSGPGAAPCTVPEGVLLLFRRALQPSLALKLYSGQLEHTRPPRRHAACCGCIASRFAPGPTRKCDYKMRACRRQPILHCPACVCLHLPITPVNEVPPNNILMFMHARFFEPHPQDCV